MRCVALFVVLGCTMGCRDAQPSAASPVAPANRATAESEHRTRSVPVELAAAPEPAPEPPPAQQGTADLPELPPSAEADGAIAALPLTLDQARALLGAVGPLSASAASFEPFSSSDIAAAVRRGDRSRSSVTAWAFAPSLAVWRPAEGVAFQVLSGRVGDDRSLLAVLRATPSGYEHVASTTLEGPESTFAIGYRNSAPAELLFTSCYGCPGESGSLRYDGKQNVTLEFR